MIDLSLLIQLVSIFGFVKLYAEGVSDIVKSSGLSESPWNIPLLILIGPVSRTPYLWPSVILVFQ